MVVLAHSDAATSGSGVRGESSVPRRSVVPRHAATGMPFTPPPPPGVTRHQDVKTDHADTSSNEVLVSRFLKAIPVAMLVSAVAGIGVAAPPALAGPARIGKITVKHVRLDWAPPRTAAQVASLKAQTAASTSIPMFTATVHDGGSTFRYTMVGKNPFVTQTQPSTTVNTTIIPVVIKFSNGDTWDPTSDRLVRLAERADARTELADLRRPALEVRPDERGHGPIRRRLPAGRVLPPDQTDGHQPRLPREAGTHDARRARAARPHGRRGREHDRVRHAQARRGGDQLPRRQIQRFITGTLGPRGHARTFPLFLLDNVVEYIGTTSNCCVLGYHNAMANAGRAPDLRRGDVRQLRRLQRQRRHRRSCRTRSREWMNDPSGTNPTKPWGNIGQVSGCQGNLEVGDPLVRHGDHRHAQRQDVPPAGAGVLQLVLPLVAEPRRQRMVLEQWDVPHVGSTLHRLSVKSSGSHRSPRGRRGSIVGREHEDDANRQRRASTSATRWHAVPPVRRGLLCMHGRR